MQSFPINRRAGQIQERRRSIRRGVLEEFFEPIREQRRERHHENEETDGERRRSRHVAAKKEEKPGDHEADE